MADGMLRNMQSPINSKYHKLQVQLVFQQGVLFCSLYFRLALHVSANAIFRSTTVSWQPLVCGWFSVFVIPCGRYLSSAVDKYLPHGITKTENHPHTNGCQDTVVLLKMALAETCRARRK